MTRTPVVLGVESSCDETGFGIVSEGVLLGQGLASSAAQHADFGGVVPEIAARAHLDAAVPTLRLALADAGVELGDITHVAATSGPGLATAVHVGLAAAKSVAWSLDVPLYGVHHLAGHAAADTLEHGPLPERSIVLIVSGGHTSILAVGDLVRDPIEHLGDTLDDAAGEAFDKVSRLLGLGYPGGPAISRAAAGGDPTAFSFPRAMLRQGDAPYTFSFSGLKTAVARTVETIERAGEAVPVADVAASFEQAVVDVLVTKAVRAVRDRGLDTLVIVGGVAANARLREAARQRCESLGITLRIPPIRLCTDNGAMIAAIGDLLVRSGAEPSGLGIPADPSAVLHGAQLPLLR
ncbi:MULTISPECIES: tRNA (adenosine(37)-N6)-threonylcarbamoyltransferase complex transferase subunit TsaD [Brachybacterium]|uniref:tRNA N6-adenosine threonylcarbamoyltransferase n=1 Tax=Brachybacterium rhamnosum TaxID=173361 RepID=A0ABW4Q384_9MICO|nr:MULTISPECIES: tRNA (adenosine(37)-N6)-threonylcarbamoyltransferase complex transferase subunit TsaD [Brachybacterium]MCW1806502.1 tRNA (adenosine(37)-N6)-threonylcarbamoyltransferase complex transferase subunit TsaD [Brachybacterium squillarum]QCR53727.1 tRNA (adenosine(37)-N6)-threonylcarbamoyltransferase complex transferase subunit TsaD [Brachybacterium sp. SGAir0954]